MFIESSRFLPSATAIAASSVQQVNDASKRPRDSECLPESFSSGIEQSKSDEMFNTADLRGEATALGIKEQATDYSSTMGAFKLGERNGDTQKRVDLV